MKRKKEAKAPPPFAVRLPSELQERLRNAGGERGMGEEIRRRLEKSFEDETPKRPADPKLQNLFVAMAFVVAKLKLHFGNVWEDRFSFDLFRSILNSCLDSAQPEGAPIMKLSQSREPFGAFLAPDASPESITQAILVNLTWFLEERARGTAVGLSPEFLAALSAAPGYSPSEEDVKRAKAEIAERKRR